MHEPKAMHIVIIPSWYPRDPKDIAGSFFREQALALQRSGCQIGVVTTQLKSLREPGRFDRANGTVTADDDEGVFTVRAHGTNWTPRVPRIIRRSWVNRGARAFAAYVRERGLPDILHVHSMFDAGLLATQLAERFGIPYVVTEHSTSFPRGRIGQRDIGVAAHIARNAARRIAVSPQLGVVLESILGPSNGSWEHIPNLVKEEFLTCPIRARGNGPITFVNVALMDAKKGQDTLLRAFAVASRSNDQIALVMVGDGPRWSSLQKLVSSLGISSRVRFTGRLSRSETLAQMAAADALVQASRFETFGVVVVEALALGKPVVTTRSGGPESIVRPTDGILVAIDDVDAMARAMLDVSRDIGRFSATEIREGCRQRYGEAEVTRALKELYTQVRDEVARGNIGAPTNQGEK